ncbi:MAG TPA: hypothetical protein IGS53_11305 [Leptolyngbyaceae cyanobacterium M33_DOE_097]|uniref:DUF1190 domain-containing protein n=1 Tax=Oscillatoriales cyanobacterium SpSt-418 TaxID=2282169 RepID=A0A7C3PHZ0_9CYAN|nr:hypothetical protein [Leptolyngbyaceae cyanobacterium M33_DOE_097]
MLRKTLTYSLALTMLITTVGCGGAVLNESNPQPEASPAATGETRQSQNRLSDGQYGVQQATYNDGTGEYSVVLLDTKPGESSVFRANNLRMARLTEAEVKAGKKSYFKVEKGQPSLHLTEDFKIEYVHNVTETQVNPQTQQRETVVVRQESSFWTPFAGALAGQALGSLLFTPQYYVPPIYSRGGLSGFGGYGSSYDQAVNRYQTRYNAPPAEVRNRQVFRSTGQLRTPTSSSNRPKASQSDRSSGSGFGSSTLRRSNSDSNRNYRRNRGFGSGFGSRSRGLRRR